MRVSVCAWARSVMGGAVEGVVDSIVQSGGITALAMRCEFM